MKYETVIFDFDGTIADTQSLTREALNALAEEFNFLPISHDELPSLSSLSAKELLVKRLKVPVWNVWKAYKMEKRGREEFASRSSSILVFPGMKECIQSLKGKGYTVGIVSSNSESAIKDTLKRFDINIDFVHAGSKIFGKERAMKDALKIYSLNPLRILYVGDELRDIEVCKKIGIDMVAVAWGFNSPEALRKAGVPLIEKPEELQELLF